METTFCYLIFFYRGVFSGNKFSFSQSRDTQGNIRVPESLQPIMKGDEMDRQCHILLAYELL
jgi:hypothetical protein